MIIATALVNIFNLLYQLFMVRNLDATSYGILNSIFAIIMILGIPALTIQMSVTNFVSRYNASGQFGSIKAIAAKLLKRMTIFGGLLFLVILIFSGSISDYLKLPTITPVIVMALVIFLSMILPVLFGMLQGLQKFVALGVNYILVSAAKLVLGVIFISMGFGATGALGALGTASMIIIFTALYSLKNIFDRHIEEDKFNLVGLYKYLIPVGLSQLCFMVLTHLHIVLVKHFFSPEEAGVYSVASMTGRMILFLPAAIGIVMFPKSSHRHATKSSSLDILKKSLLLTAIICIFASALAILFPNMLIRLFSVKNAPMFTPLSNLFAISMIFFALLNIVIFHNLATQNLLFLSSLALITILQIVGILLFHANLFQVLYVVCLSGISVLLLSLTTIKYKAEYAQ